jgi:hypothetical protein
MRRVDGDVVDEEALIADPRTTSPTISPPRSATITRWLRITSA